MKWLGPAVLVSAAAVAGLVLMRSGSIRVTDRTARPNILLITLDTMRADRIGAYGYGSAATPALDQLARDGVRFEDATSQSPLTGPAHTALLTAVLPTRLGVRTNAVALPSHAVTLAERLKDSGYRTGAFIGAFVLDRQYGFAEGFDVFDAAFPAYRGSAKLQAERRGGTVVDAAIAWLGQAPAGAPVFAWVHLYDAHAPYAAPDPYGAAFLANPYDGEVAYVDAAVGRLIHTLSASGALDRTIVAAIGDHGESLGEHGEDEHGVFLYESVLRIPWIMRLPRGEHAGRIVTEQVRSIDLAPTLLDLAGLPALSKVDGESVAAVVGGRPRRDPPPSYADAHYPRLHYGWSLLRSLRVPEWKYIDAPRPELYDLRASRAESDSVMSARGDVAGRMAAGLEQIWRGFGAEAEAQAPQPDAETVARLRSLGYAGIAAPPPTGGRGADPKDKIRELAEFRTLLIGALADLHAGREDAAIAQLHRAVTINERAFDAHVMLGDAWLQKGNLRNALGEYDTAALLNPEAAAPHLLAAEVHRTASAFTKALARVDDAAAVEPGSGEVAFVRGRILEDAGRVSEALAAFEKAVVLNPSDNAARGRFAGTAMTLRRFDVAEPELKVLLAAGYQPARTLYAIGFIAESRGDFAGAAAAYRRALSLDPALAQAAAGLARVGRQ